MLHVLEKIHFQCFRMILTTETIKIKMMIHYVTMILILMMEEFIMILTE